MQTKVRVTAALLFAAALFAQNPNPPPAQPAQPAQAAQPAQRVEKEPVYVRRVSAGATLTVLGLPLVPKREVNPITTSPAVDALYTTESLSRRVGYGITAQLTITERFAATASLFLRRVGYKMTSDIYEGTDNPNTAVDERKHTVRNEDTRAKLYDLPVVVRYYGKDRHQSGARWFIEAGAALRRVTHIKTAIDTTIGTADTVCCDVTPAKPELRTLRGLVAGAGFQLIDPIGIRVVPEVRYTRWMGNTFSSFSTLTQRNQVEGMISLTF